MGYGKRLREIRKRMGFTLEHISQKTKFTKSFISQIENGKNSPSIASLKKICAALGTTISDLFENEKSSINILHKDDYQIFQNNDTVFTFMASKFPVRKLEPVLVELNPKSETYSESYQHVGEEFGYMIEGEVMIVIGEESHILKAGDSVYFSSNIPHKLRNETNKTAKAIWIGTPPSF